MASRFRPIRVAEDQSNAVSVGLTGLTETFWAYYEAGRDEKKRAELDRQRADACLPILEVVNAMKPEQQARLGQSEEKRYNKEYFDSFWDFYFNPENPDVDLAKRVDSTHENVLLALQAKLDSVLTPSQKKRFEELKGKPLALPKT